MHGIVRCSALLPACLALALVAAAGCGDDGTTTPTSRPLPEWGADPDSLLAGLVASYERREIELYASLLARDFKFFFQARDITPDIPQGVWNRTEDSTGTRALFDAPDVLDMEIDLLKVEEREVELEGETLTRITVQATLAVPTLGSITHFVNGDRHDFTFRSGRESEGEDPGRWYLVRWEDVGQGGGVGRPAAGPRSSGPQVESTSWGSVKARY